MGLRPVAVIISGGVLTKLERIRSLVKEGDMLVCADGGALYARDLGLIPTAVIGDFDSLTPAFLTELRQKGSTVVEYPREKDYTDTDLAVQWALDHGAGEIILCAALGGRPDHAVANLALAERLTRQGHPTLIVDGEYELRFLYHRLEILGQRGDLLSLIPWGGAARGIRTTGLYYPLRGEDLFPGETRGISNRLLKEKAVVELQKGCLLVVHQRRGQDGENEAGL